MSIKEDCLGGISERRRDRGEGSGGEQDQSILHIYAHMYIYR
jgi:hypothetical protein